MNHDPHASESSLPSAIDPALEARLVAWILGEASAFEAAELERLCGEQPELATFKRRLEAVHVLTAEASRAETPSLHLGEARRSVLLATLQSGDARPEAAVERPTPTLHPRWWASPRVYGIAASIILIASLGLLALPRTRSVREYASPVSETTRPRYEELRASPPPANGPAILRPNPVAGEHRTLRTNLSPPPPAPPAFSYTAPADAAVFGGAYEQKKDGTISLSPFIVEASADAGYAASATLAGTRLNTELRDIGSAVSIISGDFYYKNGGMADSDSNSITDRPGGVSDDSKNPLSGESYDAFSPSMDEELALSARDQVTPNSILFGSGSPREVLEPADRDEAGAKLRSNPELRQYGSLGWSAGLPGTEAAKLETSNERQKDVGDQRVRGLLDAPVDPATAIPLEQPLLASRITDDKNVKPAARRPAAPDEISTQVEPVSTFSLHVSDVSFRLAQAALARGEAPDPARIRPEEFYNAFDYGDPAPTMADKIACLIEQAAHPVLPQRNLVRIAVRVPATGRGAGQPLRLTVLLDTSGSMERADRAASVQQAIHVLASLLGPQDRVTLIGFARQPRLLVEDLPGDQAVRLSELVAQTPAAGGTNLEAALQLALAKAGLHFDPAAQNRLVLVTDGAANLGNADPERLRALVSAARQQGLAFDACGIGTAGLDDTILEALTRQGDGRYYVIDSPADADAGFARQLAGAFRPAAENVKLQVRFNPARVAHYRLIGFEQHRLRPEDFRNDQVDAAELAAEEAAVAVYQIEPRPDGEGELGEVSVRFRAAATGAMVERAWTMSFAARAPAFDRASATMQLAGVAALLAEKLQGGAMAELVRLEELAPVAHGLGTRFPGQARVAALLTMFEQARRLSGE